MARYKYLSVRPVAEITTTEGLMDFESVLSLTIRKKRYLLIRNTVLITALITIALFSLILFSNTTLKNNEKENKSDSQVLSDSTSMLPEKIRETIPKPESTGRTNIQTGIDTGFRNENKDKTSKSVNPLPEKNTNDQFKIKESFSNDKVFIQAEPINGFDSLYAYFDRNLMYPDTLLNERIEGNVVIEFIITKDGTVGTLRVIEPLHPVLDSRAITCIRDMPSWKPATLNGMALNSTHSIPLRFRIVKK